MSGSNFVQETEEGRQILVDKPRIDGATLERLSEHPPDTLGGVYYAFMKKLVLL